MTKTPDQHALRYQRLNELFTKSCQLERSARKEFLDEACGNDSNLKREVLRLLQADQHSHERHDPLLHILDRVTSTRAELTACPEEIGNYRVVRKIAEGGMGTVYEAVSTGDYQQRVAIKLLKRGSEVAELVRRFRDEVRFLAVLGEHQNIAGLLDSGTTADGVPYLVMQFVDGQRIDHYCDEHRLTIRDRLNLFLEACAAVEFAHQHTVIHRDLKPNNILITRSNTCQLIDFGIAKLLNSAPRFQAPIETKTLHRVFTPEYASPEQASGEQLTTASDVYSLGVILYELLSGHRPHENEAGERLGIFDPREPIKPSNVIKRQTATETSEGKREITTESVSRNRSSPLSRLKHDLSGDLDNIVLMALRPEPTRRYGSAEQLAADIRRHLSGLPVVAREDTLRYRCSKFVRRNRVTVGAAALISLSLVIGVVGVSVQWLRAEVAVEDARNQRDSARWEQYRANMAAALVSLQSGNTATVSRLLARCPPEYRSWEWQYVKSHEDMSIRVLPGPKSDLSRVSFSADGTRLATISQDSTAQIWDVATHAQIALLQGHEDEICDLDISADGTRLATTSFDLTARLWDINSGTQIAVLGSYGYPYITFSPDGKLVAAACDDHTIRLWNAINGTSVAVFTGHNDKVNRIAFRPDGKQIASGSFDKTVRLWDVASGKVDATLLGHTREVPRLAYSPNGSRLVTGGYFPDTAVRMWDVATGKAIATLAGHKNTIYGLSFNSAGDRLVSASSDQTARVWDGQTGKPISVLRGHRAGVRDAQFLLNSSQIVTASDDSTIMIWESSTGDLMSILSGHTGSIASLAMCPSRTLIASSANDRSVRLWNTQPGIRDGILRGHENFVYDVKISPDDSQAASVAWDGALRIWDLKTKKQVHVLDGDVPMYFTVAFNSDGTQVACGSNQRTIHLWNLKTLEKRVLGKPRTDWYGVPVPVAFSPDGKWIAGLDSDHDVSLWNIETGVQRVIYRNKSHIAISLAFQPDGRHLMIGMQEQDNLLVCWDIAEDRFFEVPVPNDAKLRTIEFSRDGSWLAVGGESQMVYVLDTTNWKTIAALPSPSFVYAISFGVDGKRMACGCRDNTIRLWDTATWQLVAELTGHQDYVHALAFTHDGTRLVSGSGDFTVRIWDTVPLRDR